MAQIMQQFYWKLLISSLGLIKLKGLCYSPTTWFLLAPLHHELCSQNGPTSISNHRFQHELLVPNKNLSCHSSALYFDIFSCNRKRVSSNCFLSPSSNFNFSCDLEIRVSRMDRFKPFANSHLPFRFIRQSHNL